MKNNLKHRYHAGKIIVFVLLILFVVVGLSYYMYNKMVSSYGENAIVTASIVAGALSDNYHSDYLDVDADTDDYVKAGTIIAGVGSYIDGLAGIYVMVPGENDQVVCFYHQIFQDGVLAGYILPDKVGQENTYSGLGFEMAKDIYNADMDYQIFETHAGVYNNLLTGYSAVTDQDGHIVAIVAVAFSEKYIADENVPAMIHICSFIAFFAAVGMGLFARINDHFLIYKMDMADDKIINHITNELDISKGNGSLDAYDSDGKKYTEMSLNQLVDEFMAISKAVFDNKNSLEKTVDEYERERTQLLLLQTDVLEKTLIKNYENDDIILFGDLKYISDYSGYFYDFFKQSDGKYAICSGSVMDRDIVSVISMMLAKMLIKDYAFAGFTPEEILDIVNNKFVAGNDQALFVRSFLAEYDREKQKLYYSSASGAIPIVIRGSDTVIPLVQDKKFMPIGAWEDTPYEVSEVEIKSGDVIVLYDRPSDEDFRMSIDYDFNIMAEIVRKALDKKGDIIKDILAEIEKIVGKEEFEYSLLVLKFK